MAKTLREKLIEKAKIELINGEILECDLIIKKIKFVEVSEIGKSNKIEIPISSIITIKYYED